MEITKDKAVEICRDYMYLRLLLKSGYMYPSVIFSIDISDLGSVFEEIENSLKEFYTKLGITDTKCITEMLTNLWNEFIKDGKVDDILVLGKDEAYDIIKDNFDKL